MSAYDVSSEVVAKMKIRDVCRKFSRCFTRNRYSYEKDKLSNKDVDAISDFTSVIRGKLSGTNKSLGDLVFIAIKNIFLSFF